MTTDRQETKWSQPGCVGLFFVGMILIDVVGMLLSQLLPTLNALRKPGIQVTVQNTGSQSLGAVVLHVTGESYDLGGVTPGASTQVIVRPSSESHLEIEFTDGNGNRKRLNAGGYFERGYRGTIRVSVKDGVIDKNEQEISLP